MKINEVNGVKFLTFAIFENILWLRHCFSTKSGGVSTGSRESMNLSFKGDSRENVRENYRRLCEAAGLSYEGLTFSSQEHGTNIKIINLDDKGKGFHRPKDYTNIDGIITKEKGIVLTTFYADCTPLYFCDVKNKVIAMSHAGWRGTVDSIASCTIDILISEFGCNKEDIKCAIGPSIGFCCFEVDYPVYNEFINKLSFSADYIRSKDSVKGKFLIDLKGINRQLLLNSGIAPENIEICTHCTKCESDLFFSHRRTGTERGSMAGFMEIVR